MKNSILTYPSQFTVAIDSQGAPDIDPDGLFIFIVVKLLVQTKANSPIFVTLDGMVTLVILELLENATSFILVTPFWNIYIT